MRYILFLIIYFSSLYSREWKYLYSEAFKMRYILAADFMKDMDLVVEVGGYKTPIIDFLPENICGICIDPRSEPMESGNKKILSEYFSEKHCYDVEGKLGVVLIGMDLNMNPSDWNSLMELIKRSKKLVIGYPNCWSPSKTQHNKILKRVKGLKLTKKVLLDFSGNDFGDLKDSWPPRVKRLLLFYENS